MEASVVHETINIRGIPVKFPFTPYKCQIDYMDSVIASLQEVRFGIQAAFWCYPFLWRLTSPNFTGKECHA